ncbi:MAG: NAD-binding protein [Treponema sp.]|nr:NAD-binding protein [Treponema sp.]MCR5620395.1 NAD-binding protein [Treponema sp.]
MSKKKDGKQRHFFHTLKVLLKTPSTYAYLSIILLIVCMATVVYNVETKTGSGIETKFDTFYFMCVAVFAGYFEYVCESLPGRAAAITLLITGTFFFSYIRGNITALFVDIQEKKDKGLKTMKDMNGHFIICGWRPGFEKILKTVLKANPEISTDMIVLINEAPEQMQQLKSHDSYKDISYVSGDFTDESTLKRACIKEAERILVISDKSKDYSELEVDSRTVLAVLTIENLNPGLYVVAELMSPKFEKHLKMAHCDEIILTQDYEQALLATASSGQGYSHVISTLISSNDANSGILIGDIPSEFVGKTYGDLKAYEADKRSQHGLLIGILLNSGNFHHRRTEALREAQKNPDISKIIDNLQKVKQLKSNEPVLAPPSTFVIPRHSKAIFVRGKAN